MEIPVSSPIPMRFLNNENNLFCVRMADFRHNEKLLASLGNDEWLASDHASQRVVNLDGLRNVSENFARFPCPNAGGEESQLDNLVGQFVIVKHRSETMSAVRLDGLHRDGIVISNARSIGNTHLFDDALAFAPFHFVTEIFRDRCEIIGLWRNPNDHGNERESKIISPKCSDVGCC